MKQVYLLALVLVAFFTFSQARARTDLAAELKHAQEALEAGDYQKAFAEYARIAEEKNNPLAQFTLALFFQNGWGRPPDPVAACQWFEKAAGGDIPVAQHFLAECLAKGIHRPADPAQAAIWYESAAALGHYISLCCLAELYMKGSGVPKDPAKGLDLCKKAAEKRSIPAKVRMGRFLLEGDHSIRNYGKALAWFEMAAQMNSAEAQYYLGLMARDGLGMPKTPENARYWFELAASKGYVPAYFPTARLYFHAPVNLQTGKLSEHDLAKAYLWASATARRSKDPEELSQTSDMLKNILAIMPETWIPTLDAKLAKHLAENPVPP